jgi:hypothetical protein
MKILRALVRYPPPSSPPGVSWVELVLFQSIGGDMCRQRRHSNELAAKVVNTYWLRVKMAAGSPMYSLQSGYGQRRHSERLAARDDLRRETSAGRTLHSAIDFPLL